ncbi:MAG: ChbG/HpnK family deacetylase [Anaerolineae bacterium]
MAGHAARHHRDRAGFQGIRRTFTSGANIARKPAPRTSHIVVTADDFGRLSAINAAIMRAHREGILTCAACRCLCPDSMVRTAGVCRPTTCC